MPDVPIRLLDSPGEIRFPGLPIGAANEVVYRDLLGGEAPAADHWRQAYEDGFQPPLHPMALGLANLTGISSGIAGRVLNALLTALATVVIFRLARRVAGRRTATTAAVLHLVYPTFTFFAHSLWAEPLFVLLLVCAAERALAAREAAGRRRHLAGGDRRRLARTSPARDPRLRVPHQARPRVLPP